MIYRQPFSTAYYPPMPILEVWLSAPAEEAWHGPFSAIIDTGADFTIVPLSLLQPFNPPIVRPATLSSQWQEVHPVYIYEIDLRLSDFTLPGIEIAGDPYGDVVLLGRNVLNRLDLRLQGPAQVTHLLK